MVILITLSTIALLVIVLYMFYLKLRFAFLRNWPSLYDKRFRDILYAFFFGFYSSLRFLQIGKIRKRLLIRLDRFYQGFAFEGAGMGLAFRASFRSNKGKHFEKLFTRLSPGSIYQYYIGLGWFMHLRYQFRLNSYDQWLQQLDHRLGPVLFDGVAFKECFFHYHKNKKVLNKFNRLQLTYRRICYQGFGRSLWFIYHFNLNRALSEIEKIPPEFKKDAVSGLGLAVAYSLFDDIHFIFQSCDRVGPLYKAAYIQGVAFGLEARKLQDEFYWYSHVNQVTTFYRERILCWLLIVQEVKKFLMDEGKENFYIHWIDQTREIIESTTILKR